MSEKRTAKCTACGCEVWWLDAGDGDAPVCKDCGPNELAAEIAALRSRVEEYRAALRDEVIFGSSERLHGRCCLCFCRWDYETDESHAPGCLAAPEKG